MASMQSKRHLADYNPLYKSLSRSSVQSDLAAAKAAVRAYKGAAKYDRRAFCAFMLFDLRD